MGTQNRRIASAKHEARLNPDNLYDVQADKFHEALIPPSQHKNPKSDIEISQAAKKRPILELAKEKLGIACEDLESFGHYKAKVSLDL